MKSKIIIFFLASIVFSCSKPMAVESFDVANIDKIVQGGRLIEQHYLIHNWKNTKENELKIDSFVCRNLIDDFNCQHAYFISFYKYSSKVNSEYYKRRKKLCELEMVDALIFSYSYYSYGVFLKYKGNLSKPLEPLTDYKCDK